MSGEGFDLVLAVDDEPANQRAICRALLDECRVLTAGSAGEGLERLREEPIALVVADQRMPGMSGIEFLQRAAREYPEVVRVMLTGYADVAMITEAINQGHVYHFLHKPWEALELRQVVRRGLEKRAIEAERARLLGELQGACERIGREAERKTRLLATTAHELGTPTHILINALALLRELALPEAAAPWLDAAERAGAWLVRGVAQLNAAARLGVRALPLRASRFEVGPLLRQSVVELRRHLGARSVEVTDAIRDPSPTIEADREWVRLAVWNLLTNAVRFTPDGGSVSVSVTEEAERVVVAVSDSGVGIPAEHHGEVFEPFSGACGDPLLHGSGRLEFGARGLGLGLALVREVARAHGGEAAVESRPGAGSRFTLHLPRRRTTGGAASLLDESTESLHRKPGGTD
jgi:signal transduction histidine kinase